MKLITQTTGYLFYNLLMYTSGMPAAWEMQDKTRERNDTD